jgi:hypothetical protein
MTTKLVGSNGFVTLVDVMGNDLFMISHRF